MSKTSTSTINTSNTSNTSPKVFTWASVAGGKKHTQADIEADRAKVRAHEEEKKRIEKEKLQEGELRARLIKEKKEHEFEEENSRRLLRIAQEEKERKEHIITK